MDAGNTGAGRAHPQGLILIILFFHSCLEDNKKGSGSHLFPATFLPIMCIHGGQSKGASHKPRALHASLCKCVLSSLWARPAHDTASNG
jgi:hypothetical protein